jgi:phage tail-like protein
MEFTKKIPLSRAAAKRFQTLGARLDPYYSYNFLVEIDHVLAGGFTEVSGLQSQIEVESYKEGGWYGSVHQFPKQVTYPNLVLRKGFTGMGALVSGPVSASRKMGGSSILDSLWTWYEQAALGNIILKNGTIMLLDRQRIPIAWWTFKNAYPIRWKGPEFNASSNEVAVEEIELVHQGLTEPLSSRTLGCARTAAELAGYTGL